MSADIALVRRQIEAQLCDYEQEITAYRAFMSEWRARHGIVEFDPETGEILTPAGQVAAE